MTASQESVKNAEAPPEEVKQYRLSLPEGISERYIFYIEGTTPLLLNGCSEEAKEVWKTRLDFKNEGKKWKHPPKNDKKEARDKCYTDPRKPGDYFMKTSMFQKSMEYAGPRCDIASSSQVNAAIRFADEMVEIQDSRLLDQRLLRRSEGDKNPSTEPLYQVRCDVIHLKAKDSYDLTYRPMFSCWVVMLDLDLTLNQGIDAQDLIDLFNFAGTMAGVGAFRRNCSGNMGQYEVANLRHLKAQPRVLDAFSIEGEI